jgi:hypothetical protein
MGPILIALQLLSLYGKQVEPLVSVFMRGWVWHPTLRPLPLLLPFRVRWALGTRQTHQACTGQSDHPLLPYNNEPSQKLSPHWVTLRFWTVRVRSKQADLDTFRFILTERILHE